MTTSTVMKKLSVAVVGAASITLGTASLEATPAQAASFSVPFSVNVTLNSTPSVGTGTIQFDSDFVTGSPFEAVFPGNGLESLDFSLLGNNYTEASAIGLPALFFSNGAIQGLLFSFVETTTGQPLTIFPVLNQVFNSTFQPVGSVSVGNATPVPTPALLPGLIGLGMSLATLRKRQTAKVKQA